jgi:hypothetical protein
VAQRPITVPRLILSPHLDFDVTHNDAGMAGYLDAGVSFGITDDFEVNALVMPLQLWAPNSGLQYGESARFEGPSIGATYRFVRGQFELGVGVEGRVFTVPNVTGFSVEPRIPMRFHATDALRLDLVPSLQFVHEEIKTSSLTPVPGTTTTTTGGVIIAVPAASPASINLNPLRLFVPLRLIYNVESSVHVGVNSGLTIYDLSDTGNSTGIPFGVFGGYAVASPVGPLFDIDPFVNFPYLLMPGRHSVFHGEQWVVGLNLTGHIYL